MNTCWRNKKSGTFQHFPEDSKRSLKNKKFKYIAVILYQNKCSSATVIDKFSVKLIVMSEIIRHTKKNVLKVIFMKKVFRKVFFFFIDFTIPLRCKCKQADSSISFLWEKKIWIKASYSIYLVNLLNIKKKFSTFWPSHKYSNFSINVFELYNCYEYS